MLQDKQIYTLFLTLVIFTGIFGLHSALSPLASASVVNISLYGSATGGWGFTLDTITNPGPKIIVNKGDLLNLTLTSADGIKHNFFVDYNGDTDPSPSEPKSPDFTTTINYQFTAYEFGNFTYYCQYHKSTMYGTFLVAVTIRSTGRIATATIGYKSEIRGMFVHSAAFAYPTDWDLIAQTCKDYGIDRIYVEIAGFQGSFYHSDITGDHPEGNHLEPALDACHSRGLELHVAWDILFSPSDEQAEMWCVDTHENPYRWGCPTNPATRDWVKSRVEELVGNFDIDGFMFDYIRYEGSICYCSHCKAAFEEWLGETITEWPGEFGEGGSRRNEFMEWRVIPITELVRDLRNWMRAIKPDLEFSVAAWTLFQDSPIYWRTWIGQDTADWVGKDYLDVVAPMMYTSTLDTIRDYLQTDLKYFVGGPEGKIPLLCFLTTGVTQPTTPENFAQQIELIRSMGADGWIIWRYGGPGTQPSGSGPDIRNYLSIVDMPPAFTLGDIHIITLEDQATITWTTDSPATSKVEFSTSPLFIAKFLSGSGGIHYWDIDHIAGTEIEDNTPTTNHNITLTDLLPETKYYFRVQSEGSGGIATSRVLTFTTPEQ